MKKHLLSMYGNFCKNKEIIDLGKTTYETSTIETTDTDEFFAMGGTYETRSQENTDPDEFIFGPTSITKSVEATDEDEFIFCGPTMVTENVENSDPDEFLLQGPTNLTFTQENTDEDEFLSDILSDFNNKDFDGMEKEFNKIKSRLVKLLFIVSENIVYIIFKLESIILTLIPLLLAS